MKIIGGIVISLLFWGVYVVGNHLNNPADLTFRVPTLSTEKIQILIENEPVIKKGNLLYPITLTTKHPIRVTVGDDTKKISLDHLRKTNMITLDIVFRDKRVHYLIQTLPAIFPDFKITNPLNKKGYIFISLHGLKAIDPAFSFISDTDGNILFYRGHNQNDQSIFHLKKFSLPDGKIRYATHIQDESGRPYYYMVGYHLILDEDFHETDRIKVLKTDKHEALLADEHDIIILGDKHYIITAQDPVQAISPDGRRSPITHTIIQEQQDGRVLWDWDSEDHPELQSICYEKCPNVPSYNADYIHVNSISLDPKDNNLLVSSASGYYVMKLDRKTGNILWILGGKGNQFQMPDEAAFVRQHHVDLLPDGRLVIFDNQIPSLSQSEMRIYPNWSRDHTARILILDLDEENKRVKSVEIIPLNFKAPYMGSAQKLDDKTWFIGCGTSDECTARMIDTSGNILWNMHAKQPYKMFRAYYYETLN